MRPASGVTATIGSITLAAVRHLHFTGNGGGGSNLTVGMTKVNDGQSGSATNDHLTWDYLTFSSATGCWNIYATANTSNILIDHTRHDNIDKVSAGCTDDGRITTRDSSTPPANWIVVSNSHFGGGGCSDGIQVESDKEVIGPGNEFANLTQGGCGPHVDAFSTDGGTFTIIGNYFHNNTTGISNYDVSGSPYYVRNNVIVGPFNCGCAGIMVTGGNGIQATHNTVIYGGAATSIGVDIVHDGTPATNAVLTGNITDGGGTNQCGSCTATWTYNLQTGRSGTGNINGTPVYVSSPASGYYHYQLASSSPGYHAASDGKSMGIAP